MTQITIHSFPSYKDNAIRIGVIALCLIIMLPALDCSSATCPLSLFALLIISIYQIVETKDCRPLCLLCAIMAYVNYSIVVYFFIGHPDNNPYTSYIGSYQSYFGLNLIVLFQLIFTVFLPLNAKPLGLRELFTRRENENTVVFILICFVLVFVIFNGYRQSAVAGERGSTSKLYEFATSALLVGYYFSGSNKAYRATLAFLSAILIFQGIYGGDRIVPLQLILIYFTIYHLESMAVRHILILGAFAILALGLIGQYRGEISSSINGDSIIQIIRHFGSTWGAQSTFPAAFHCSLTFLDFGNSISPSEHFYYFIQFFKSFFLGTSNVADSNLAQITRLYYWHNYGGIFPFFGYFHFGILGLVFEAMLPSLLVRFLSQKYRNDTLPMLIGTFLVVTVFRWYVYSPIMITRTLGQFIIIYLGAMVIARCTTVRHDN